MFDGWLEFRHTEARGTSRLYRRSWLPDGNPRAAILLAHGLGEHSGRYEHVAAHCVQHGFAVHAVDHYGHGKSTGHRGHVERFSVYVDGIAALLDEVRNASMPLFLLGHSMGGLIAARVLLTHQAAFRACVISGPLLRTDAAPPGPLLALVRLISRLAPTAPLTGFDAASVSRDPEVVAAYMADPLVHHGKLSARLISEISRAMNDTLAAASGITLPILIMHGDDDRLTSPAGSVEFYERVGSVDKTLRRYRGLYHEIFNEPEKDTVLGELSAWLEERL